jgi:rubrerythrin
MKVFDFAIQVDKKGRDFYKDLASRAESEGVRRIFNRLAEDEIRLMRGHRHLKRKARQIESGTLNSMEEVFEPRQPPEDEVEAYRLALEVEGQVCRMFSEAADQEKDQAARRALREVANAECGELREIEGVLDFVKAPNEFLAWGEFSNLGEFHNFGRYQDNRPCRHTA